MWYRAARRAIAPSVTRQSLWNTVCQTLAKPEGGENNLALNVRVNLLPSSQPPVTRTVGPFAVTDTGQETSW